MGRLTGRFALAGIVSAALGIGAGHLAAAVVAPAASPVLAVGTQIIDHVPTSLKDWAIRQLGTNDKPVLIAGVLVGTLVLAAVGGMLARRSHAAAFGVVIVCATGAGACAFAGPIGGVRALLPAGVTGIVSVAALWWLIHGRVRRCHHVNETDEIGRRQFLAGAGFVSLAAIAFAGSGQWLMQSASRVADVVLPAAKKPLDAIPEGLHVPGLSPLRTPIPDFYRVDTNLTVPTIDPDDWSLRIDGDVTRPITVTFEQLLDMDLIERDITLTCVSNEVGGTYVGSTRWLGVRLSDLLDRTGTDQHEIGRHSDQILSESTEGFTISTPLSVALDGRDSMVAVGMNGQPLTPTHGFPARLLVPGLYGFVGATKWLHKLTLTTYDKHQAYWTQRGWDIHAPIKMSSRIDTPKPLATLTSGKNTIGGVAWAQQHGVAAVEVRIDDGQWQPAKLGADVGTDYWRQWYLPWDAASGRHVLAVRAIDRQGHTQTARRADPFPGGSSGIHHIAVTVE